MPTYNNTYSNATSFASSLDVTVDFASGTNVCVECLCWTNGNSSGTATTGVAVDPAGINQALTADTDRSGPAHAGLPTGRLRSFSGIVVSPPSGSVVIRMTCANADARPQMWVRLTNDVASVGTAVETNANNRSPSWTVTSATGDLVSAMYVMDTDDATTLAATSPATQRSRQTTAVSGASPAGNYLGGAVLDEAGASSVTIDGSITGGATPTWAGTARNLVALAGGSVISGSNYYYGMISGD